MVKYKLTKRRQLLNFNLKRVLVIFYHNYLMRHLDRVNLQTLAYYFLNTVDFYAKQSALNSPDCGATAGGKLR